jgi:hypothetical protein
MRIGADGTLETNPADLTMIKDMMLANMQD